MTTNPHFSDYSGWTREQLIQRVLALEGPRSVNRPLAPPTAKDSNPPAGPSTHISITSPVSAKEFNYSHYPRRKIALKFCYSGSEYSGLAYQPLGTTQAPTVEGVLFEAFSKARLIDPEAGMEGCGWEKCGRTDRGVSAAGQVISLWVRSALGHGKEKEQEEEVLSAQGEKRDVEEVEEAALDGLTGLGDEDFGTLGVSQLCSQTTKNSAPGQTSKPRNELDYIAILNRLLPPTIRILAWAPVAPTFSARFSCKYRHYKYFFPSHDLDIPRMREAASRLVGEHDFRNLCKIDAQKQITVFRRIISRANIEPVGIEGGEGMYVFNLVGSAFLYHQVRHIMAILLLIGTGLEKPSLVTKLMNVARGAEVPEEGDLEGASALDIMNGKPEYQMADALPLMLWDCGYAEEDVKWRTQTSEDDGSTADGVDTRRSGSGTETDLYHQLHCIWSRSRIYTALDKHFLLAAEKYHAPPSSPLPLTTSGARADEVTGPFNYPIGGGSYKRVLKYVPVLQRNRLDPVEVINERWRMGKGMRRADRKTGAGREEDDLGDE